MRYNRTLLKGGVALRANAHAATSSDNSIDRVPTHRHIGHAVWALPTAQEACRNQPACIIGLTRRRLEHGLIEQCHAREKLGRLFPAVRPVNDKPGASSRLPDDPGRDQGHHDCTSSRHRKLRRVDEATTANRRR